MHGLIPSRPHPPAVRRAVPARRGRLRALASWRGVRVVLVLGGLAAMLSVGGPAEAAVTQPSPGHHHGTTQPATNPTTGQTGAVTGPGGTVPTTAQPGQSSGVCSVPGIGDIGSLAGFCAAGSSGLVGDLNNICQPSVPTPEPANGGIDALVTPPGAPGTHKPTTLYGAYGMAGQSWAAYNLQCSDMASLIGNNIAGVVFDAAKAADRVTITVYQSAAGTGILSWLTGAVDRLITSLGNAVYFPYLAPVVILGAIWMAWQGLIRKRATRTIEGTVWMVVACAAAVWLISRPADFTGLGQTVSNGITQTLNVAFAKLPAPHQSECVPVQHGDPQVPTVANYGYTSGNSVVDTNASELWTVLVCKPWLDGEFGTTSYAAGAKGQTVVNQYGRQLLWSQAIAANEKPTANLLTAKQNAFTGIANSIQQKDPAVYPVFQGKQWTTRLEVAFAALFAALVAGVLVLLIAVTLIVLKLGFLLLLVAGPFFLIIGTHPGFGRVIALRWAELLIGVLLKQAAIALVLSVLLYAYSLIMGASDAVLPWALKILMIALVTVAVFIYRKPFTHLFSAVGYGVVGARDRADAQLAMAGGSAARNTLDAATVGIPGVAVYRAARWARRNPAQAVSLASQVATAGATGVAAAGVAGAVSASSGQGGAAAEGGAEAGLHEAGSQPAGAGVPARAGSGAGGGSGPGVRGRARDGGAASDTPARTPPPLDLPARQDGNGARPASGWARSSGAGTSGAAGTGRTSEAPTRAGQGGPWTGGTRSGPASGNGNGAPPPRPATVRPAPPRSPVSRTSPAPSRAAAPGTQAGGGTAQARQHAGGAGAGQSGTAAPAAGGGRNTPQAEPFWLRPLRRRK
ncbi:MAG TPA: type IV secretion system protein [Streptosporangiaceae bacterium]|nr:type IV secretion system protein [Streptosporangiaceae bacterium]